MRPTRRALGLVVAAALLVLIGSNTQAGWLYVLAALVLGAAVAGALLPPLMVRGIEVERRAPEEAFAGDDVPVDLVVRNTTRRTKLALSIVDPHIAETIAFVDAIGPRQEVVLTTTRAAARRGVVDGEPVRLRSSAPFGVATASRRIPAPGRTVVYPRVVRVDWVPEAASATKPIDEAHVRSRKGVGQDFISVREYQQGDSLRYVHWPTTARIGQLMVREFEQELPRRLGIVVDTWADTGVVGRGAGMDGTSASNESVLDAACAAAASVAMHALGIGHPLAMAGACDRVVRSVDGPDPAEALTWLAELRAPGGPPLETVLPQALPLLGRLDTLVVVMPTWAPNAATALVEHLADLDRGGLQTVAVLVEAHTYGRSARATPMTPPESIDQITRDLAAAGVAVYRVRREEDLAACLMQPLAA
ncbi:MAG: DUF58 domain-containing protein [Actinomycetota bacterium]